MSKSSVQRTKYMKFAWSRSRVSQCPLWLRLQQKSPNSGSTTPAPQPWSNANFSLAHFNRAKLRGGGRKVLSRKMPKVITREKNCLVNCLYFDTHTHTQMSKYRWDDTCPRLMPGAQTYSVTCLFPHFQ